MATRSLEIVEVTLMRGLKGERKACGWFDRVHISRPDPDDWTDIALFDCWGTRITETVIQANPESLFYSELPTDWHGLSFRCVGESFDDTVSGGIEHAIEMIGAADVFEDWTDELIRIGAEMLDRDSPCLGEQRANAVKFLTLWEYEASRDYDGEWDENWQMLGVLDTSQLKKAVKAEEETTAATS